MKALLYFLIFTSLAFSSHLLNNTNEKQALKKAKHTILVLPPYDLVANEGISPNMRQYLETVIAKDTTVVLIKFPVKKLTGVQYQNVFDKKFCTPILAKVKADIIVMSMLQPGTMSGDMLTDKWNCSIRVYNTVTGKQFDSKLIFKESTAAAINAKLIADYAMLSEEIK